MILRPELDENDLDHLLKEDFDKDASGYKPGDEEQPTSIPDFIENSKLFDSIFELADTWCPNIDEFEYSEFINTLKDKLHGNF